MPYVNEKMYMFRERCLSRVHQEHYGMQPPSRRPLFRGALHANSVLGVLYSISLIFCCTVSGTATHLRKIRVSRDGEILNPEVGPETLAVTTRKRALPVVESRANKAHLENSDVYDMQVLEDPGKQDTSILSLAAVHDTVSVRIAE